MLETKQIETKPRLHWRSYSKRNAWIVMRQDGSNWRVVSYGRQPDEALLLTYVANGGRSCKTTPTPPPYPERPTSFSVGV